eukprot:TRINITY_DN22275_c0_g1_i1.p1 TRINITY_DN22275_c0_g1~~TRINITY_DN22275_c0_g1_i1.p1  ORF type:complete len:145 (+),score=17.80 TRINITY_DN22275_c0_g1_i1:119-553(+)
MPSGKETLSKTKMVLRPQVKKKASTRLTMIKPKKYGGAWIPENLIEATADQRKMLKIAERIADQASELGYDVKHSMLHIEGKDGTPEAIARGMKITKGSKSLEFLSDFVHSAPTEGQNTELGFFLAVDGVKTGDPFETFPEDLE